MTKYYIYISWFINLLEPINIHNFSPQMVYMVLRVFNTCVLVFCVVAMVWPVWDHGSFYGFQFVDWFRYYFYAL